MAVAGDATQKASTSSAVVPVIWNICRKTIWYAGVMAAVPTTVSVRRPAGGGEGGLGPGGGGGGGGGGEGGGGETPGGEGGEGGGLGGGGGGMGGLGGEGGGGGQARAGRLAAE